MKRSRRTFSNEFKRQVVEEYLDGRANQAQLCRRYEISPTLMRDWRRKYDTGELDGSNTTLESLHERELMRRVGVLYQSGALWSSMTLAENVGLPLGEFTDLGPEEIREVASLKLALVGLSGFEDYYPSEISGGMQKRAGLARAIALDPEILFFDEPGAGLDPLSSRLLDDLILELRDSLGATVVIVTHELASIFAIGTDSVFLDAETRTMIAKGPPAELRDHSEHELVHRFLSRET